MSSESNTYCCWVAHSFNPTRSCYFAYVWYLAFLVFLCAPCCGLLINEWHWSYHNCNEVNIRQTTGNNSLFLNACVKNGNISFWGFVDEPITDGNSLSVNKIFNKDKSCRSSRGRLGVLMLHSCCQKCFMALVLAVVWKDLQLIDFLWSMEKVLIYIIKSSSTR